MSNCKANFYNERQGSGRIVFEGCNLNCSPCLWKREGVQFSHTLEEISSNLNDLEELYLEGGEPLLCEELFSFLFDIRKKVKVISLKTNGTVPSLLKNLVSQWLVDRVELWLNGPVTECDKYCGKEINPDLFIASITTLMNWAGEQMIVFVVREMYEDRDFHMTADLLEGARNLRLLIKKDISLPDEIVNRFKAVAGEFDIQYF